MLETSRDGSYFIHLFDQISIDLPVAVSLENAPDSAAVRSTFADQCVVQDSMQVEVAAINQSINLLINQAIDQSIKPTGTGIPDGTAGGNGTILGR